ncbi:MAG TPA: T9SS type A sorting domain-containing protein [Candidatus Krumholzibacteria bacterium]|nr:T9SS type A sorting domain-containing protein [Candidatus Krumholzibacteria bacterium]
MLGRSICILGILTGSGLFVPMTSQGDSPTPLSLPIYHSARICETRELTFGVENDSFEVDLIAELDWGIDKVAFGDSDHDGWNEIILAKIASSLCSFQVFEVGSDDTYSLEYSGVCLVPQAVADLDADGKSELVGESGYFVEIYESPDVTSHPMELVWTSPPLGNVERGLTIGDTDGDGQMEIITSHNTFGSLSVLVIFENRGDNTFALVLADTIQDGAMGRKALGDWDGDGMMEVAFSSGTGRTFVYESTANDRWGMTWCTEMNAVFRNAYATCTGDDLDGNGRAELFVTGTLRDEDGNATWTTFVYEAPCDNTFIETARFSIEDGTLGGPHDTIVDIDRKGRAEFVMETAVGLWIYGAAGPGQWNVVGHVPDPTWNYTHEGIYAFDVNQNGKPELVWPGYPTTLVMEHRSNASNLEASPRSRLGSLVAWPNPSRTQAQLMSTESLEPGMRLRVFDAAGRLVDKRVMIGDAQGRVWWPTSQLANGMYLLRLENRRGQLVASGRGIVAH